MVYNGRLFSFLQISSWNLPKWRYINSPFVAFIQIFNYNNFALFLPGRPFLFVKGILSLFISPKLTVPEDKDYFSSGNTRLRRSSAKWRTAGISRKVRYMSLPRCLHHLRHAYTQVGVYRCMIDVSLEGIARTQRKSLACGKVTLHHGIHRRAGPPFYQSSCAYYSRSCSPYSPLMHTAKVTDHHGSDFSSRTSPRRQSRGSRVVNRLRGIYIRQNA